MELILKDFCVKLAFQPVLRFLGSGKLEEYNSVPHNKLHSHSERRLRIAEDCANIRKGCW